MHKEQLIKNRVETANCDRYVQCAMPGKSSSFLYPSFSDLHSLLLNPLPFLRQAQKEKRQFCRNYNFYACIYESRGRNDNKRLAYQEEANHCFLITPEISGGKTVAYCGTILLYNYLKTLWHKSQNVLQIILHSFDHMPELVEVVVFNHIHS